MEKFVSLPDVGDLFIGEVFAYYDGPKLFALNKKDSEEPIFISYWIGDEEDSQDWVLIPLTKKRVEDYKNNEIDLLHFLNIFNEENIYKLSFVFSSGEDIISEMTKEDISSILWPKEGLYFNK